MICVYYKIYAPSRHIDINVYIGMDRYYYYIIVHDRGPAMQAAEEVGVTAGDCRKRETKNEKRKNKKKNNNIKPDSNKDGGIEQRKIRNGNRTRRVFIYSLYTYIRIIRVYLHTL